MNSFKNYKIGKEKFITNDSGKIESEKEGYLNKKEALKFL